MREHDSRLVEDVAMTATITSAALSLRHVDKAALQCSWPATGTPIGTLTLQGSCDPGHDGQQKPVPANWSTIDGTSVAVTGAAGDMLYNIQNPGYKWLRLVYTRTSGGTGAVLNVYANVKGP